MNKSDFRIANRSDVLALLDSMVEHIEKSNAAALPGFRGKENAIGNEAWYWPRLEAVRDAVERELI
jgi:hypothetical protein